MFAFLSVFASHTVITGLSLAGSAVLVLKIKEVTVDKL